MWKKILSELVPYISVEDGGGGISYFENKTKQNMSLRSVT